MPSATWIASPELEALTAAVMVLWSQSSQPEAQTSQIVAARGAGRPPGRPAATASPAWPPRATSPAISTTRALRVRALRDVVSLGMRLITRDLMVTTHRSNKGEIHRPHSRVPGLLPPVNGKFVPLDLLKVASRRLR